MSEGSTLINVLMIAISMVICYASLELLLGSGLFTAVAAETI